MYEKEKDAIRDAMPLSCKVRSNGKVYDGVITWKKRKFPLVIFDRHGKAELSWDLAKRCMIGECKEIIY